MLFDAHTHLNFEKYTDEERRTIAQEIEASELGYIIDVADCVRGAEQALKKLSAGNAMVIVSTHDFELCELTTEDGSAADNYHFEEYYENDQLRFDYKIKDGRCTTRNAMAILKMAGLVQN